MQQDLEWKGTGAELVTVDRKDNEAVGSHVSFLSADGFTRAETIQPPSLCPGHIGGSFSSDGRADNGVPAGMVG